MQLKPIVQGLAAVWLVLFLVSFVSLQSSEAESGATGTLGRVAAFLTWQTIALFVALVGALAARFALQRGADGVKLVGFLPLALSVFLIASFIALTAFRFYVAPLFE
jgi:hypothetical protein